MKSDQNPVNVTDASFTGRTSNPTVLIADEHRYSLGLHLGGEFLPIFSFSFLFRETLRCRVLLIHPLQLQRTQAPFKVETDAHRKDQCMLRLPRSIVRQCRAASPLQLPERPREPLNRGKKSMHDQRATPALSRSVARPRGHRANSLYPFLGKNGEEAIHHKFGEEGYTP